MDIFTEEEGLKLVREFMSANSVPQKDICKLLGLSKYDVSKIFHNKRKLYLDEFVSIAYHCHLISPDVIPSRFRQSIIDSMTYEEYDAYRKKHYKNMPTYNEQKEKEISDLKKVKGDLERQIENLQRENEKQKEKISELEQTKAQKTIPKYELSNIEIYNAYEEIWKYIEDTDADSEYAKYAFYELLTRIKKALNESQFSTTEFLEYQRLKKNQNLIENQYVFNLADLLQ